MAEQPLQNQRMPTVAIGTAFASCVSLCAIAILGHMSNIEMVSAKNTNESTYSNSTGRGLDMFTRLAKGILKCNGLDCPEGTSSCWVYQTTQHNQSMIDINIMCMGKDGKAILQHNSSVANVNSSSLNDFAESSVGDGVWSCYGCEGSNPKEIKRNMRDWDKE